MCSEIIVMQNLLSLVLSELVLPLNAIISHLPPGLTPYLSKNHQTSLAARWHFPFFLWYSWLHSQPYLLWKSLSCNELPLTAVNMLYAWSFLYYTKKINTSVYYMAHWSGMKKRPVFQMGKGECESILKHERKLRGDEKHPFLWLLEIPCFVFQIGFFDN